jgi:serine/threonine protein kinase/predicted ATPase
MSITPERWKKIEELYNAALETGPRERMALLEKASPDLREIVGAMLAQQTKDNFLDRPAWESETDTQIASVPSVPSPKTPIRSAFGHYRVEIAVGSGGMGDVYRAWDSRLKRRVAIKSIRLGCGSPEPLAGLEARFLEEARAASALNHPNIITIYDIGTADECPYLVMEWIEGETLRQKLTHGPLPIPDVLAISTQIADALTVAHDSGILHRDLKPENIMVTAEGRVKVLDFGIAKRISIPDGATQDLALMTLPGSVVGTPAYMSPEQARGEKLDFRSDHFSFGVVLYEMTAGRRAFSGKTPADLQAAILLQQPDPLTRVSPQAPAPLQWIVERCLAKSPQDRFASTAELWRELQAISANASHRAPAFEPIYNLPSPRTALIGREEELASLRSLANDRDLRVLTLTGAGGIGKTRLAIELARELAGDFGGGVCFVPLEKVNEAGLVSSEIARVLGVVLAPDQNPEQNMEASVHDFFRRRVTGPMLLLLDNFEHVLDAAGFIAGLASDRLKVIVTSRAPLRVYGEYEFPVPPLHSADDMSPAVRLFIERAPGLRGVPRDREQRRIISEICARLDGLPLAIELAAARTKLLPLKTLLERLHDPLGVLVGGPRDLPRRQHTLRDTVDWSYNLLDTEHQKLFRRLAVFVGGATIEGVEAVCDTRSDLQLNLWNGMELLADNSLVRRVSSDEEQPRFAMLETMRDYGLERLASAGEESYTRKAHAAYCLVMAEEAAPALRRQRIGKHPLDAELGNFRAALDWLTSAGEVEWGLRMLLALTMYFLTRRLHVEAINRFSRMLALPGVDRFPRLRNWGRYWEYDLALKAGTATADQYLARTLNMWELFEEAHDLGGMFMTAHRIGVNLAFERSPEARSWLERAVEIARSDFPPTALAGAISGLADVVKTEGDFVYARALHLEAMRLFEDADDKENAIWSLSHQADLALAQGQEEQAGSLYLDALSKFRALGFPLGVASCLHDLASLETQAGKFEKAWELYHECLRLYSPDQVEDVPRVLESLAELATRSAQPELALTVAGAAAGIRERFTIGTTKVQRALVERNVDAARKQTGAPAADHWMKGWNMSIEEITEWVAREAKAQ